MRTTRFQTMSKAARLVSNGVKPSRDFSSTLKSLHNYRALLTIKKNTPKTKKTKRMRRALADLILRVKRTLGIKVEPNREGVTDYLHSLPPEARKQILISLKESLDAELPKVIATKRWKDMDGVVVQ